MSTAVLEVKHLRVEFPTRRGVLVAVDDVSLAIQPGEILGVVGESGAGKSMTGMAVLGLLEPPGRIAQGEILLAGQRIDNLDEKTPDVVENRGAEGHQQHKNGKSQLQGQSDDDQAPVDFAAVVGKKYRNAH